MNLTPAGSNFTNISVIFMDDFEELEYFGLISRLCKELENHIGVSDKVLAEYVVDLHRKSNGPDSFKDLLENSGGSFTDSFTGHLYETIRCADPRQKNKPSTISILSLPNNPSNTREKILTSLRSPGKSDQRSYRIRAAEAPTQNLDLNRGRSSFSDNKLRKRISSPERFELKQLLAAGAISSVQYSELMKNDNNAESLLESSSGQLEIELVDEDPAFLKGRFLDESLDKDLAVRDSLLKIIRNPEGSLFRTASSTAASLSELREQRKGMPLMKQPELPEFKNSRPKAIREQRESLPIFRLKRKFIDTIEQNQITVVIGETGSGKTTQITQYLYEAGYSQKLIGCTQPRRVAAMSVAQRVSEEMHCKLGGLVGYTIRFEDCTSSDTRIKYMTDGMLLRECLQDPLLPKYSVIMLDEAHERTIHTDVLFCLLKCAASRRSDLKLIVTSATLDVGKFSSYFSDAPIFMIPGKIFPVEIIHSDEPVLDYIQEVITKVVDIHTHEPPGDILVFLTGKDEIELVCDFLNDNQFPKHLGRLLVLPVYAALPGELQNRIFSPTPPGYRKVVVATNIAETSITIDGIYYVIDCGFCKQKAYNPKMRMDTLMVTPISQAQAKQRAGRAGRTGPGKCFRLYTEKAFEKELLPTTIPEIQRTNLSNTVLTLKAMGINDLLHFDFMDPPSTASLLMALESLYTLGALDEDGFLTKLGYQMAEIPIEPPLAKMLIVACDLGCSDQILSIVSMLSVQNIFYRPRDKADQADRAHRRFHQSDGDHLTLLAVWEGWLGAGKSSDWCQYNFIQCRSLKRALDVKNQLASIIDKFGLNTKLRSDNIFIRKALCSGLFMNAARRDPHEGYKTLVDDHLVALHPSSTFYNNSASPTWVIYHELVMTSREFMREVTSIDPRWLVDSAPTFFRQVGAGRLSKRQLSEKIIPLHKPGEKPDDWRISKQRQNIRRPVVP